MAELLFWDQTPNIIRFALGDLSSRAATVPLLLKHSFAFKAAHSFPPFPPDNLHRDSFVGFAAREGAIGIYAADATRNRGDISGESLPFQFTIEDNTKGQGDPRHAALRDGMPYKVPFALHIYTLFRLVVGSFLKSVDR